jgi:LmbE family N-acetylglucosaminyl deacetylase
MMGAEAAAPADARAQRFLQALARVGSEPIPARTMAIVTAHPDDETIGIGGQIFRLDGITIVHVTDGAPRHDAAEAHGFATREAYAAARRKELSAAIALADVPGDALVGLGVSDQETCLCLPDLARRLADLFRERAIDLVITHALEGGHPDHDATAFAVHAAAALIEDAGPAPALIEMPLYHLGASGWTVQLFVAAPGPPETAIRLSNDQRRRKQAMLDAHETQRQILSIVTTDVERFRPAPAYDFTVLPNEGRLLYELYGWGMTGTLWQSLVAAALEELALDTVL